MWYTIGRLAGRLALWLGRVFDELARGSRMAGSPAGPRTTPDGHVGRFCRCAPAESAPGGTDDR